MVPEEICVSGLPLCWRGCNGIYKSVKESDKKNAIRENFPVWELPEHVYLGIIIRPMLIHRCRDDTWVLRTNDSERRSVAYSSHINDNPIGNWDNCLVTERSSFRTWWASNNTHILSFLLSMILFGGYMYRFCNYILDNVTRERVIIASLGITTILTYLRWI